MLSRSSTAPQRPETPSDQRVAPSEPSSLPVPVFPTDESRQRAIGANATAYVDHKTRARAWSERAVGKAAEADRIRHKVAELTRQADRLDTEREDAALTARREDEAGEAYGVMLKAVGEPLPPIAPPAAEQTGDAVGTLYGVPQTGAIATTPAPCPKCKNPMVNHPQHGWSHIGPDGVYVPAAEWCQRPANEAGHTQVLHPEDIPAGEGR